MQADRNNCPVGKAFFGFCVTLGTQRFRRVTSLVDWIKE